MDKVKIKVEKGKASIEEGEDTFVGKLLTGHKGKVTINTPLGETEIKITKKRSGIVKP